MQIECGGGLTLANHCDVWTEILEQPAQGVLDGQRNLCAGGRGQQRITGKMDRISIALFPINKKPLLGERPLATPEWLRIFRLII